MKIQETFDSIRNKTKATALSYVKGSYADPAMKKKYREMAKQNAIRKQDDAERASAVAFELQDAEEQRKTSINKK